MGDCLPKEQLVVYQVVREASLNAVKHAHPTRVEIVLTMSDDSVTLAVEDDGEGFDPETVDVASHFGLGLNNERVRRVDGVITIDSRKGRGTRLLVVLPSRPPG
jgi:signal transduction histidine kinase